MSELSPDLEDEFDRLMEDMQVLYSMKAGHVVSQDDLDALNRLDKHYRDKEESVTDAFSQGYDRGKADAGGTTLAAQMDAADTARIEAHVARMMEGLIIARHDKLLAAAEAAYRFISSPQRMNTPKGGPKTATYRIENYNALTAQLRDAIGAGNPPSESPETGKAT